MRTQDIRTFVCAAAFFGLISANGHSAFAWWWKHPDRAVRIELNSGANPDHTSGKPAVVQGRVHLVDAVTGKDLTVPKNVTDELDVKFYFPSKADPVEGIQMNSSLDFSFTTPALVRGDLNVFSVVVGRVSKKTHELEAQEAKLQNKAHQLRVSLDGLQRDPKTKPARIAEVKATICLVEADIRKIRRRIDESMEVLASYDLPVLVDDGPAEPARSSSLVAGFLFETRFDPSGVPFAGQSVTVRSEVTDLRHRLPEIYGHCDRGTAWEAQGLWNGSVVTQSSRQTLREGQSFTLTYATPSLKATDHDAFSTTLLHIDGKKPKEKSVTVGTYSMALEVSPPYTGPAPTPVGGYPQQVSIYAERTYNPPKSLDGTFNFPVSASVIVPSDIAVLSGNAGNLYLTLQLDDITTCLYRGGAHTAHPLSTPKNTSEITLGQKYLFQFCKNGLLSVEEIQKTSLPKASLAAGGKIRLFKYFKVHVDGGDSLAPTLVQAQLNVDPWYAPDSTGAPAPSATATISAVGTPGNTGEVAAYYVGQPMAVILPQSFPVLSGNPAGSKIVLQIDDAKTCTYSPDSAGKNYGFVSCTDLAYWNPLGLLINDAWAAGTGPHSIRRKLSVSFKPAPPLGHVFVQIPIQVKPATVIPDTTPPAWSVISPPASLGYVQSIPAVSATLRDSQSAINPQSVKVALNGQDVTSQLSVSCNPAQFSCTLTGTPNAPEGPFSLTFAGKDSAGNAAAPFLVGGIIDRTPPSALAAAFSFPNPDKHQALVTVMAADASPFSSIQIQVNGGVLCQGTHVPLVCQVQLAEGANAYTLTAIDAAQNQSTASGSTVLDTIPPQVLSITPASGATLNVLSTPFSGTASEALSSTNLTLTAPGATPIAVPLVIASDRVSFSGTVSVPTYADYQASLTLTDTSGNSSVQSILFHFVMPPPPPPVLATTLQDHLLVAVPSLQVPITVSSPAKVTTQIILNGALTQETTSKSFTANLVLTVGKNSLVIQAKDEFGAQAAPITFTDVVFNPPALQSGLADSAVISPAFNMPTQLSDGLLNQLSLTTSLAAWATSRTDLFSCQTPLAIQPPSNPNPTVAQFDPLAQITPKIQTLANELGSADQAYFYVRDQIAFLPRFGATQTAEQTLLGGYGTGADKAVALIALLRAQGAPAQYVAGEILVDEPLLKNLYGVQSPKDLAWAQTMTLKGYFQALYPSGFDGTQMVYYRNGARSWRIPHVWVLAQISTLHGPQWQEIDPSGGYHDFQASSQGFQQNSSSAINNISNFLFFPNSWDYTLADTLAHDTQIDVNGDRGSTDLSLVGAIDPGVSVLNRYSIIPSGNMGVIPPCVSLQADILPIEYQFTSHVRVTASPTAALEASLPLAELSEQALHLIHQAGATDTDGGTLSLKQGNQVLTSITTPSLPSYSVYHAIQEPVRYGGAVEARITPNRSVRGIQVLRHTVGPVSEAAFYADFKKAHTVFAAPSSTAEDKIVSLLQAGSSLALVKADQNDQVINRFRGVSRFSEHLLVSGSRDLSLTPTSGSSVGVAPSQIDMDWDITGPIYSRTGDSVDFNQYSNIANAKGELVVANSSLENQVWEDLFGGSGISAAKIIQQASNPAPGTSVPDMVRGDALTSDNLASISGRLSASLQNEITLLQGFTQEAPYLFSLTNIFTSTTGWSGSAFIIAPSLATGQAGAYLISQSGGGLLGGNYSTYECTGTAPAPVSCVGHSRGEYSVGAGWYYYENYETGKYGQSDDEGNLSISTGTTVWSVCEYVMGGTCGVCVTNWKTKNGVGTDDTTEVCASWPAPGSASRLSPNNPVVLGNQAPNLSPSNVNGAPTACSLGKPVNLASGSMWHRFIDFEVPGRTRDTDFSLQRTYTSHPVQASQDFGPNWWHNWETQLMVVSQSNIGSGCDAPQYTPEVTAALAQAGYNPGWPDCSEVQTWISAIVWLDEDGGPWTFIRQGGSLIAPVGLGATLTELGDSYLLTKRDGTKLTFYGLNDIGLTGKLKSITEPHGETVQLIYDASGKLQSISTGLAGTLTFSRNSLGLVDTITRERDSLSYHYTYTANGRLESESDFDGNTTRYEYNAAQAGTPAANLLTTFVDPLNRKTTFTYYDDGRAYEQTEPGNGYRAFFYSANSDRKYVSVQDIDHHSTEFRLDGHGLVSEIVHPDTSRSRYTTQFNGSSIQTDEEGASTTYNYNDQGDLIGVTHPDGSTISVVPDATFGKPSYIQTPVGSLSFTIDPQKGDITHVGSVDSGLGLDYTFDALGNIASVNNGRATYNYDHTPDGLLSSVPDAHNPETRTYDNRGRLATRTFQSGRVLTYSWDNHDRLTRVDDTAGPSVIQVWDSVGRLTSKTVTDGSTEQKTQYKWDDRDRLIQYTDAMGRVTQIQYDKPAVGCNVVDKPTLIIDPAGRKTQFFYDLRQRLVRQVTPDGGVTRYEYNQRGDLTALTDPENNRTQFFYDRNGRMIRRERPSAVTNSDGTASPATEVTTYQWDAGDRMIREENGLANGDTKLVTVLTYDSLNRLTRKTLQKEQGGQVVEVQDASNYTYQPQMDASLLATANNGVANLSFDYDLAPPFANLAFEMRAADPANPLSLIQDRYAVARDASGEISGIVAASSGGTLISAEHDPMGRLTKLTGTLSGQSLTSTLTYDSFGRKRGVVHSTGMIGSFSWDLLNRPTSIYQTGLDGSGGNWNFSENLTYNAQTGNVDQIFREFGTFTYQHDTLDQLKGVSYSGSANLPNQLVNRTLTFDYNGNRLNDSLNGSGQFLANVLISDGKATYAVDPNGLGNLIQNRDKATGATQKYTYLADGKISHFESSALSADYAVDALGRRIAKRITPNDEGSFAQSEVCLGETNQVLLGKGGDGVVTLYLQNQAQNQHLGDVSNAGVKAYVTDHLGSVMNSSAAGGVPTYSAWGETLGSVPKVNVSSPAVVYGFQGMRRDLASGLDETPHRSYSQSNARWNQKDPIWPLSGTNAYTFVANNSLYFIDPSGLDLSASEKLENGEAGNTLGTTIYNYYCIKTGACTPLPPNPPPFFTQLANPNLIKPSPTPVPKPSLTPPPSQPIKTDTQTTFPQSPAVPGVSPTNPPNSCNANGSALP